jgi:hypothetical protein
VSIMSMMMSMVSMFHVEKVVYALHATTRMVLVGTLPGTVPVRYVRSSKLLYSKLPADIAVALVPRTLF